MRLSKASKNRWGYPGGMSGREVSGDGDVRNVASPESFEKYQKVSGAHVERGAARRDRRGAGISSPPYAWRSTNRHVIATTVP